MIKNFWISLAFLMLIAGSAIGQTEKDSIVVADEKIEKWVPIPKKAALLSLIPGAGQIYNRQYAWIKVPIIYGAMGGFGYWAYDDQSFYERFRDAHKSAANGEVHEFGNASVADLKRARDNADKNRQRRYITIGVIYIAQIVEAYVAAHLIDFDIEDDLSLKLRPTIQDEYEQNVGFGAILSF